MNETAQNQYVPDYAVPPGEILLESLVEKGMSQAELADRTGRKRKTINEIIKGKAPITPETALQLERVLGVPASFWNNLEQNYRADLARLAEKNRLEGKIEWLKQFPVRELTRLGWLGETKDKVSLLRELLNFFGVASPERWHEMWKGEAVAYRRSPVFESNPQALSSWLRMGELEAHQITCRTFNKKTFKEALAKLRGLSTEGPETFCPAMVRLCAAAGVAVVFVPELPKTRVSGAARWLTPDKALIQLSLRHKSNDHLWFSFYHEAGHILLHGKKEVFIDDDKANPGLKEDEANRFAADILIPPDIYARFKTCGCGRFSKMEIQTLAREIGIAPGIVVGRLQHDGKLPPSHCNGLKVFYKWQSE